MQPGDRVYWQCWSLHVSFTLHASNMQVTISSVTYYVNRRASVSPIWDLLQLSTWFPASDIPKICDIWCVNAIKPWENHVFIVLMLLCITLLTCQRIYINHATMMAVAASAFRWHFQWLSQLHLGTDPFLHTCQCLCSAKCIVGTFWWWKDW